jgi:hypothetical protein
VLCVHCRAITNTMPHSFESPPRGTLLPDRFNGLLCSRCSTVLPSPDPDGGMLTKLTQLSRFGLGADDRPLLDSTNPDRSD